MTAKRWLYVALFPLAIIGGCIAGDELTTLTIHPDGSADVVIMRANVHSTSAGERAATELAEYKTKFDNRSDDAMTRIEKAGGKIVETTWVRKETPLSCMVNAHLPDVRALEKYGSFSDDKGETPIATKFHMDGNKRKLVVRFAIPGDANETPEASPQDVAKMRQQAADGISETRVAVAKGVITAERGFIVARDKQSALLDIHEVEEALRAGKGTAEIYLEWEVSP